MHVPAWASRAPPSRSGWAPAACGCSRWSMRSSAEMLDRRVLHADETPVAMLKPDKGTTHRAYLWAYAPGAFEDIKAVVPAAFVRASGRPR